MCTPGCALTLLHTFYCKYVSKIQIAHIFTMIEEYAGLCANQPVKQVHSRGENIICCGRWIVEGRLCVEFSAICPEHSLVHTEYKFAH